MLKVINQNRDEITVFHTIYRSGNKIFGVLHNGNDEIFLTVGTYETDKVCEDAFEKCCRIMEFGNQVIRIPQATEIKNIRS